MYSNIYSIILLLRNQYKLCAKYVQIMRILCKICTNYFKFKEMDPKKCIQVPIPISKILNCANCRKHVSWRYYEGIGTITNTCKITTD